MPARFYFGLLVGLCIGFFLRVPTPHLSGVHSRYAHIPNLASLTNAGILCTANSSSPLCQIITTDTDLKSNVESTLRPNNASTVSSTNSGTLAKPGLTKATESIPKPGNGRPVDPMTRLGPNKTLMLIPVNFGYLDFALNLLCSIRRLKIHNYIFLALDEKVFDAMLAMNLPVYMDKEMPPVLSETKGWGQREFRALLCHKLIAVINCLKKEINVILVDADIVFKQDPRMYLRWDMDLTFSIGSCEFTLPDNADPGVLENAKVNTGFFLARANPRIIRAFTRAHEICYVTLAARYSDMMDDQDAVNEVIWKQHKDPAFVNNSDEFINYGFLNGCIFANGCVYFKHLCRNQTGYNNEVLVHANFLVGREEKIHNLNKTGNWDAKCIERLKT